MIDIGITPLFSGSSFFILMNKGSAWRKKEGKMKNWLFAAGGSGYEDRK
jgi:hypothetical protein